VRGEILAMKKLKEVKKLYRTKLKSNLQQLEKSRLEVRNAILLIALLVIPTVIYLFAIHPKGEELKPFEYIIIGVSILGGIYFGITAYKKKKEYRLKFKKQIVAEIVNILDPTWNYDSERSLAQEDYLKSEIFQRRVDRCRGDDFIEGKIGQTDFKCSELHTEYKQVTTDSKGRRKTEWRTIFKGLFLHADFNKHIQGKTFVFPDLAERLFGRLGNKLQKMGSTHGELVKLEDVEFEKTFAVYGSDQVESRYILSPRVIESLVKIKKKAKSKIHLSFVGSRVYCAISFKKDLFEPNIFTSGVKFADIKEIYRIFSFIEVIISDLELNTRIWSKE
jgi:hypothetical protein